jgi:hypothetical protein
MKLGIMQPYLFPYIGYFQLISAVNKFVIFDDVNYINKGWINRNRIFLNDRDYLFTIPLEKASQNRLINEIKLSENNGWKEKLLKTFNAAYKKAPMFSEIYPMVEKIIYFEERHLSNYISNSIEQICIYLSINTNIVKTSLQYKTTQMKRQDKILEICSKEKASVYINPFGGLELYQKEAFKKLGIELFFLKSKAINYKQFSCSFIPDLSIIDVMMFNERIKIYGYLNEYELI